MNKPIAAFVADHHSGGGYVNRGVDDSDYSLRQIVYWALKHKPDWIIFLGDVVDKQRNRSAAIMPLLDCIDTLRANSIQVGFIQGNHDKSDPPWLLMDGTRWLHKETLKLGDRWFCGLDYQTQEDVQRFLAEEVPSSVTGLLMHQTWSNFMGEICAPQCAFEDVKSPVTMVVTGDYHGECIVDTYNGRDGQKVRVVNPGATSLQDISEPDDKYFVVLYPNDVLTRQKLETRIILHRMIHTPEDLNSFLATISSEVTMTVADAKDRCLPESMYKPFLRVTYSHKLPDVLRRIENAVKNTVHLFPKEIRSTKENKSFVVNPGSVKIGKAVTVLDLLDKEIDPEGKDNKIDKEAYLLAETLLGTQTKLQVQVALAKWRNAVLEENS
jgi:predicted phosphodiesterase